LALERGRLPLVQARAPGRSPAGLRRVGERGGEARVPDGLLGGAARDPAPVARRAARAPRRDGNRPDHRERVPAGPSGPDPHLVSPALEGDDRRARVAGRPELHARRPEGGADRALLRRGLAGDARRPAHGRGLRHRRRRLAARAPRSVSAIHSTYFEGMSLYRQERWAEAAEVFTAMVTNFPEAQAAAESMYHLGLCRARLGNQAGAVEAWRDTEQRYAGTPWAKYAGERLAEVAGKGTGG